MDRAGPDIGEVELLQQTLRADLETIRRYGNEHPETWAGVRFDNEPSVTLVAAFTGELDHHERALRSELEHPDRFRVERSRSSKAHLEALRNEVREFLAQRSQATGRVVMQRLGVLGVPGVFGVTLTPDQEVLAGELKARYGEAVEITVGALPYPLGPPRNRLWSRWDLKPLVVEALEMRLVLRQPVIRSGRDGRAELTVHNTGEDRVALGNPGNPLVADILDQAGRAVGGYSGAIGGVGRDLDLDSGTQVRFDVIVGTASFREDLGYTLPSGRYWIRVRVPLRPFTTAGRPTHVLLSPRQELIVAE